MEQNDGFSLWVRGVEPVVNVAGGAAAADDAGMGRRGYGVALVPDGNLALVADCTRVRRLQMKGHQGPAGVGRSTQRWSARAWVLAACGVEPSARWLAGSLAWGTSWSSRGLAPASGRIFSAAQRAGKRFCQ